jgi:uncharacterized protein YceH (UPF0502 family)
MTTPALDTLLDAAAVRVLGSLMEKEATTPDNYPLTLNSLTAACNQATSRDPVMELAEADVKAALADLMQRTLVREVYRSDSRAKRFRHALAETLHLHPQELAVLCVLMLRGPQTSAEIRARTGRMYTFDDPAYLDIVLDGLATLPVPLVVQLPRLPGRKEARYAHLLAGEPQLPLDTEGAAPRVSGTSRMDALEEEVRAVRAELAELRERVDALLRELQ